MSHFIHSESNVKCLSQRDTTKLPAEWPAVNNLSAARGVGDWNLHKWPIHLARVVITCTDPAIPLLAIHPRAMFAHGYRDSCIRECIATLLILVKPSETTILTTEWIDRLQHIQMMGYPTAVEMNELLLYSQRGWVSNIMLNKRNRTEGYIVCNTVSFLQL